MGVVAKKLARLIFYTTQRGSPPKQVYQSHSDHDLYSSKQDNTVPTATHLVNNRNVAPLHETLLFPEILLPYFASLCSQCT